MRVPAFACNQCCFCSNVFLTCCVSVAILLLSLIQCHPWHQSLRWGELLSPQPVQLTWSEFGWHVTAYWNKHFLVVLTYFPVNYTSVPGLIYTVHNYYSKTMLCFLLMTQSDPSNVLPNNQRIKLQAISENCAFHCANTIFLICCISFLTSSVQLQSFEDKCTSGWYHATVRHYLRLTESL